MLIFSNRSSKFFIALFIIVVIIWNVKLTTKYKVQKTNLAPDEKFITERLIQRNEINYQVNNRLDLASILELIKAKSMIEIGVKQGDFAVGLLGRWSNFSIYYGIDPWLAQDNYKDIANVNNDIQNKYYQQALKNLIIFGNNRIKLIKDYSQNAIKQFKVESIDFIYIDARHDYCSVLEDLELYYPILKCNGILAGHDYLTVEEQQRLSKDDFGICPNGTRVLTNGGGVKGAVIDFTKRLDDVKLYQTKEAWPSFYFFKKCY